MEKKNIKGREIFVGISTEEVIEFFLQNPSAEIETLGGFTRWLRYDAYNKRIGITDNNIYDWFSVKDFKKYYGKWYWKFFIM